FQVGDLLRMLQVIGELEPRFRRSGQQRLLLELLLVRFALLDRSVELEDVLRALGGGGGTSERPARGPVSTPRTPAASSEAGPARPATTLEREPEPPAPGRESGERGRGGSAPTVMDRPRREESRPVLADAPPPWDGPPPWEGPPPEEEYGD